MELPSFTTVVEYVPRHPSGQSQSAKVTESAVLGLKRTRETVVGCFGEEELSLLSHFCSFSCMDAMNDSYSAMAVACRRIASSERGGVLFGIYKYTRRERRE